jgi:Sodium Bile acid symporter family
LAGLARCIAMVLIWTDLACSDREMATVLVALNAVFQVLPYSALGFFYLQVLPGWLGLRTASLHVSIAAIAATVAVFLGIPLAAGYLTRTLGERYRGREWHESRFLPTRSPNGTGTCRPRTSVPIGDHTSTATANTTATANRSRISVTMSAIDISSWPPCPITSCGDRTATGALEPAGPQAAACLAPTPALCTPLGYIPPAGIWQGRLGNYELTTISAVAHDADGFAPVGHRASPGRGGRARPRAILA